MILYTLGQVPPFARGQVRDHRVRWALEEVGRHYEVQLVGPPPMMAMADYRQIQPFGQVPAIDDDGLVMFETGAILLHIGETAPALLPREPAERAQVLQWLFAGISTIEPQVRRVVEPPFFAPDAAWVEGAVAAARDALGKRLHQLAQALGDRHWLAGTFSIADIVMVTVLRVLRDDGAIAAEPKLVDYVARGEARPAFQRAIAAQIADLDAG